MRSRIGIAAASAGLLGALLPVPVAFAADPWLERVSLSYLGAELQSNLDPDTNFDVENLSLSGDGRYVLFAHGSPDVVNGDTNGYADVFIRDLQTGTNELVSVATDGSLGNGSSGSSDTGVMTPDGRFVAFSSQATNLAPDANEYGNVYLRDRTLGTTEVISLASDGQPSNDTSGFGGLAITDDGRYVSFSSYANNLVADDTNGVPDLFVRDRTTPTTIRASVSTLGTEADGPSGTGVTATHFAIDGDGHVLIAFTSEATNLVDGDPGSGAFIRDLTTDETERLVGIGGAYAGLSDLSPDGSLVIFQQVLGEVTEVYLFNRTTNETELISANNAGEPGAAPGEPGAGNSYLGRISDDGRYVAFGSDANNLVGNDTNAFCPGYDDNILVSCYEAFVRDRATQTTTRVSIADDGTQGDFRTYAPSISGDGSTIAFVSYASNLVPDDTNGMFDVFVRPRGLQPVSGSDIVDPGGTVSAGSSTNEAQPVAASVTSPQGGSISIDVRDATGTPPADYSFFGQEVTISAPSATTDQPLVLTFTLDASLIPPGVAPASVQVFRTEDAGDPVLVLDCTATTPDIDPDPCVSDRTPDGNGGVTITVLTSAASIWNLGLSTLGPAHELTGLGPARVWVGVTNGADAGIRVDLQAVVKMNGTILSTGEALNVATGAVGFSRAKLRSIELPEFSPVGADTGDELSITLNVRNSCARQGRLSGTVLLWFNGGPIDAGKAADAGSRFGATISPSEAAADYFLRPSFELSTASGSSRTSVDVAAGAKCSAYKTFGTWSVTLP